MKTILFLAIAVACAAVPSRGQNNVEPALITVTGQAEIRVPPDEVVFSITVANVDKDMVAASKRTDDSVKEILTIARKNSVKSEDIQTSRITVQPKYNTDDLPYETRDRVKRILVGYEVSKVVAILLRDITRFDQLWVEVLNAGITSLSNLEFRDSQIRKHRDEARRLAIRAAHEKARLLAGEIGQSIGPAYSITEESANDRSVYQNVITRSGTESESNNESSTAPGTIAVTAQVTVRFRLQ